MAEYRRRPKSLDDLKVGDHIYVESSGQGWAKSIFGTFSASASPSPASGSGHMLIVKRIDTEKFQIVHMTEQGVKQEEIDLDVKKVFVIEYECAVDGKEAVANAIACFGKAYDPKYIQQQKAVCY